MSTHDAKTLLDQARREGGFFTLPSPLLLRLTGTDCLRYLNGQVTADLRKLIPGVAMQACLLTPKGKLSALLQITLEADALIVEADELLKEELPARLERYIVADDVTLEVIAEPLKTVHVFGSLSDLPEIQALPGIKIQRLGLPGKDIPATFFSSLPTTMQPLSSELLEVFRIERSVPRWGFELTNETLPPEARLEATSIDYEKGCYLGQEVISRLRSVGHVNRLLTSFVGETEIPLTTGMKLFSSEDLSHCLGTLTSVAKRPDDDRWIALGYLRRGTDSGMPLVAVDPIAGKSRIQIM